MSGEARLPGRPRDHQVDEAAMAAAIELTVEGGYRTLTMEGIAARAGVGKAALYRRWPNKRELFVDAVSHLARASLAAPDTGDVRSDLTGFLTEFVRRRSEDARVYQAVVAAIAGEADLAERCRDTVLPRFASVFREIVERGVARGQLPADTDVELLAEVAPAVIRHHQLLGEKLDPVLIERIAAQFFRPPPA